jgi:hypothetical protein
MRKPLLYSLIAVIVLLAVAIVVVFLQYRRAADEYAEVKAAEETARAGYAEAFNAVAEIQDSLDAVSIGDTAVRILSKELQGEVRLTELHKRQALDRIALLDASLQRSKERIHRLEANVRRSGIRVSGLEKMIAGLKETVATKEQMVAQLTGQVDSLQTRVTGLETEVQLAQDSLRAQEQAIEENRRELATIHYIIGSKRDLIAAGVLVTKGGFLGLGRTLQVSGRYNEALFTPLDTDVESFIPTSAAKVQVMSAQPTSSYELKSVADRMELHILDPWEFRKVKHLVIMTK